jgi:hypothetical protein
VSAFTAVGGINGVPGHGLIGKEIDLSAATVTVTPNDATNKTIVWSVKNAGGTGVTTADLADGEVTPTAAGTLTLTATVANGKTNGTEDYTEDFDIEIGAVLLLQKSGASETELDATYEATLDGALAWINENAVANDKYVVLLGANQEMAPYVSPGAWDLQYQFETPEPGKAGVEITLRGHGEERTISWDGTSRNNISGTTLGLFTLWNGGTLILDSNITLDGKNTELVVGEANKNASMIYMRTDAHVRMNTGSKITGMIETGSIDRVRGAINMRDTDTTSTGSVTLAGGEISGNATPAGVYVAAHDQYPFTTFTMTGGAIKNNNGKGLHITGPVTAVMSGGEISGHTTGDGYGVENRSSNFTMSGGTIKDNTIGVYNYNAPFTMTGGTIRDNTGAMGGGMRFTGGDNSGAFYVSGNVTISNNGVGLEGSPTAEYNTIIYIGSNFNPTGNIVIDVCSVDADEFGGSWGSTDGNVFLQGGTPDNPTPVTVQQVAKFTGGKACESYGFSVEKGGKLSLSLNGSSFGVAKWTEN